MRFLEKSWIGIITLTAIALLAFSRWKSWAGKQFLSALDRDDNAAMRRLLESGATPDLNAGSIRTKLWLAMATDDRLTRMALARGVDPDARDRWGTTPLIQAASAHSPAVARVLLQAGASPNLQDDGGFTALMYATRRDDELVELLLAHGAAVDTRDKHGSTALMWAASAGNMRGVNSLLARGANPTLRNLDGRTALDVATDPRTREAYALLRSVREEPRHLRAQ
jgi:ankyrin repeat protein